MLFNQMPAAKPWQDVINLGHLIAHGDLCIPSGASLY